VAKYNWAKIRDAYEIEGLVYAKITERFGVAKATISEKVRKEGWVKGKAEPIIRAKMLNLKEKKEIEQKTEQEFGGRSVLVDNEINRRLRLEELFDTDAEHNQNGVTKKLKEMEKANKVELGHYDIHARVTAKNKETLLGKTPTTQVNIQNNQNLSTDAMSEAQIREELKSRGLPPIILDE